MIIEVALGLFVSYTIIFIISIILNDNSIADVFWGLGFLQVTIHSFIISGTSFISQLFILMIIALWSLRLSVHIFVKKLKKKEEDPRYAVWRKTWKLFYLRSFFQVFILQGILLLIIAAPIFLINSNPIAEPSLLFYISSIIALFGIAYEAVADQQLKNFIKAKKKGEIMTKGLWYYSRHPNYFGESLFWLGISMMALPISALSLVSWLTITFLLRFVSGVPMAEKNYKNNKEYIRYKRNTPAMLPNLFKAKKP